TRRQHFDLIICCHINLLVLAIAAKIRFNAPLMTLIYGVDAWQPLSDLKTFLLREVDQFVSISDVTRRKFQNWSGVRKKKVTLLPNAIHTGWYGVGPRNPDLVARYNLHDKTVIMTLGRLVSSERYKGFDEVIDVMPGLVAKLPNLVYLIVGDGSDKHRLMAKASELGLAEHVRFAGMIPEAEKADHYRLADAFVMPSRGEGFGFVFLEAMACGIPVVASKLDGGKEAVLEGRLGVLVDPDNPTDVRRGILEALASKAGVVPEGLQHFSFENFEKRSHAIVNHLILAY
ncbi:MAG: glycosyltransferase family 4 protein, partial [Pseudomonadota bacterium]|nr:glycosyltransferase family 4 protein [Pseudomonadota bacterium]